MGSEHSSSRESSSNFTKRRSLGTILKILIPLTILVYTVHLYTVQCMLESIQKMITLSSHLIANVSIILYQFFEFSVLWSTLTPNSKYDLCIKYKTFLMTYKHYFFLFRLQCTIVAFPLTKTIVCHEADIYPSSNYFDKDKHLSSQQHHTEKMPVAKSSAELKYEKKNSGNCTEEVRMHYQPQWLKLVALFGLFPFLSHCDTGNFLFPQI